MNERKIPELLTRIGLNPACKGHPYLVHVIRLSIRNESPFLVSKNLYANTAAYFGVSPDSVQHGIRTLIDSYWKQEENRNYFCDIIRFPVYEPLPPKEFIAVIIDYLRRNAC